MVRPYEGTGLADWPFHLKSRFAAGLGSAMDYSKSGPLIEIRKSFFLRRHDRFFVRFPKVATIEKMSTRRAEIELLVLVLLVLYCTAVLVEPTGTVELYGYSTGT